MFEKYSQKSLFFVANGTFGYLNYFSSIKYLAKWYERAKFWTFVGL